MKAPRTKRHLLWISVLLIPGVFVFLHVKGGIVGWDGAAWRNVSVRVIDNETNAPIEGATVYLRLPQDNWPTDVAPDVFQKRLRQEARLATTGPDGQAVVTAAFGASGEHRFFRKTGSFYVDALLRVTHPQFAPSEGMLQSYLGGNEFPRSTRELQVTIFIARPAEPR